MRSISGETDLEAPKWLVHKWGSAVMLELSPPHPPEQLGHESEQSGGWSAEIPLHLRYLHPKKGGMSVAEVPWPTVFWACPAHEGTKMRNSPFDRSNLGYDGLFGPRTLFYHLMPQRRLGQDGGSVKLVESVKVPVLDSEKVANVEMGTVVVVLFGVLWIVGKLTSVLWIEEGKRTKKRKSG